MKIFTKTAIAIIMGAGFLSLSATAQNTNDQVIQESLDWKKLRVRPTVSIYIPYIKQMETALTGNLNVEAYYNLPKVADVRAGVHMGSFMGVSGGGTLHLHENLVTKPTKFTTSITTSGRTETTRYYRNNAEYNVVTGPTAQFMAGKFGDSGFYMRIDGGLDRQTQGRAYFKGYSSNKNGFTSMKLLGTVAKFNQAEVLSLSEEKYVSRFGAGGLFSMLAERRPWKRITMYLGIDLGYMKVFGAKDFEGGAVTIEANKSNIILDMKGGFSIGI